MYLECRRPILACPVTCPVTVSSAVAEIDHRALELVEDAARAHLRSSQVKSSQIKSSQVKMPKLTFFAP
mgnify:CR=1 FL=1